MGELRDGQIADLAFYMTQPRCMNLSDPGTGKTPSVCAWFQWLWAEVKIKSAWAMPLSLLEKNKAEILEFTGFKPEDVVIVAGTATQREKQFARPGKVFLMGFDCFSTNWRLLPPDVRALAVDELHMGYGGNYSKRTQNLYEAMATQFTHFLPMTTLHDSCFFECFWEVDPFGEGVWVV